MRFAIGHVTARMDSRRRSSLCAESMRSRAYRTLLITMAVLATIPLTSRAGAQSDTIAAAAVSLTRIPQLARNVWPGDFDRDGRTDLIAASGHPPRDYDVPPPPQDLLVARGRGDGTFDTPRALGVAADPLRVSDINRDGRQDVVVQTSAGVFILPGNGNGTFGSLRPVGGGGWQRYALAADFDGDGHRDVLVSTTIFPGYGDFTFGAPVPLPLEFQPTSAISGDFNGDGRPDVALTNDCCSLWILLNNGGYLFSASEIVITDLSDITTGDLNHDGHLDLVAAQYHPYESSLPPWEPSGRVAVLPGKGDGTFGPAVLYETGVKGEFTVVVGDFTHDGTLDVATGNLSGYRHDDFGQQMWDSISILKGTGTGTLVSPATFALENDHTDLTYWRTMHQLNTNDLNRDGYPDLIASPGAILLTRTPVANRAPVVFAGPDRSYDPETPVRLNGEASDPDADWLTYTWTTEGGQIVGRSPNPRLGFHVGPPPGTYTLTVDDGHGGVVSDSLVITSRRGSVSIRVPGDRISSDGPRIVVWDAGAVEVSFTRFDVSYSIDGGRTFETIEECSRLAPPVFSCVWQSPREPTADARLRLMATDDQATEWIAVSDKFAIVDEPVPTLPQGWSSGDVGPVGAAGIAVPSDNAFIVSGSGADVWGSADEFHWAYKTLSGDFDAVARVQNVESVHQWTKAGLMIRETLAAGSRHASVFATPSAVKGLAFQRRRAPNGPSVHTSGPLIAPSIDLRLVRVGDKISAHYRRSSREMWTSIGTETLSGLSDVVHVGLAVSSHVDGRRATASFGSVEIGKPDPSRFTFADVGAVGRRDGSVNEEGGVSFAGSGADIWGTADAFRYYYRSLTGDGTITVRVDELWATHPWAKAGVMFRETLAAGSKHVMAIVSPSKGIAMQFRNATGGISANAALAPGRAPHWLRLMRTGNTFTASESEDGTTWRALGTTTVAMGSEILVGLPVTSHDNTTLATASFHWPTLDQ